MSFLYQYDPWPTVDATAAERPWIPHPRRIGVGSPSPIGHRSISWLRPSEIPTYRNGPTAERGLLDAVRADEASDRKLAAWLWCMGGATYNDERANKLLGAFAGPHRKLMKTINPAWAREWSPHRKHNGWGAWGDGDAPFHYAYPMWMLQNILAGKGTDVALDFLETLAHGLSYAFDWRSGEMLAEKCGDWTGDLFPPGRNAYSHQWPEVIFAAAYLSGWEADSPECNAGRLAALRLLEKAPPATGRWGPRIFGFWLRGMRASFHFGDDERTNEQTSSLAEIQIDVMLANANGRGWVNERDASQPNALEPWQDWLVLSEIAEWAVLWNSASLLDHVREIADWHLSNTTSPEGEVAYTIVPANAVEGPVDPSWWANPDLTTYALPALRALWQAFGGDYGAAYSRATEVVLESARSGNYDPGNPSWGGSAPKRIRRLPYGIRPDHEI